MDNRDRPAPIDPAQSWIARAFHTPLSDALRGNFTGTLDARSVIVGAGLPNPVAELILRVVRDARLWRGERLDLAQELVAHFADGLASGRTTEQLLADFGNPADASRLIRKAKRRSRPLWWQAWWAGTRLSLLALAFSVLFYGVLAARFYLGSPRLAHNYAAEINARRAVPEEQRAHMLYRESVQRLAVDRDAMRRVGEMVRPADADWDKLVADVQRHQPSVELALTGSARPHMGAPLAGDAKDNPELISVVLQYAQDAREVARLLAADTRVAASKGEAPRVTRDVVALMHLAEQLMEPPVTLVEQLVGMAIFNITTDTVGQILEDHPGLFSEPQLRDLAHRIAASSAGNPKVDVEFERLIFADLLQRVYTDDGHGDGRVAPEGLKVLDDYMTTSVIPMGGLTRAGKTNAAVRLGSYLVNPGIGALFGGRRENQQLYDSLLDETVRLHQQLPWQWDQQAMAEAQSRFQELTPAKGTLRYAPVALLLPAISSVFVAAERTTQERDAVLIAIALVLWQERHGSWPTSLDELVPDLLPAVPPDRATGQPLSYAVHDGKPIIYAVGNDRDDDGGRAVVRGVYAPNSIYYFGHLQPEFADHFKKENYDGDWILWPPSAQPIEEVPQDDWSDEQSQSAEAQPEAPAPAETPQSAGEPQPAKAPK